MLDIKKKHFIQFHFHINCPVWRVIRKPQDNPRNTIPYKNINQVFMNRWLLEKTCSAQHICATPSLHQGVERTRWWHASFISCRGQLNTSGIFITTCLHTKYEKGKGPNKKTMQNIGYPMKKTKKEKNKKEIIKKKKVKISVGGQMCA